VSTTVHDISAEYADFNSDWIEIFRAGTYPPQKDWDGVATVADLNHVAESYNPEFHEAPVVVGHPKGDLPAYGWVDRIRTDGSMLLAKFKQLDPGFENLVKAGRFKKRSASFYVDGSGKIAGLRHVGFLGAQPPQVKGLRNISLCDHDEFFTVVEFAEEKCMADNFADSAVVNLKTRGRWCKRFDRSGLPLVFSALADTPSLNRMVEFIEAVVDSDPTSRLLSECAEYYAREKGITFGEALAAVSAPHVGSEWIGDPNRDPQGGAWGSGVSPEQRKMERETAEKAVKSRALSSEIFELAWKLAEEKGWPLKQAIAQVSAEHPEILKAFAAQNVHRKDNPDMNFSEMTSSSRFSGVELCREAKRIAAERNISYGKALSEAAKERPDLTVK
jgi:hypothetical protein